MAVGEFSSTYIWEKKKKTSRKQQIERNLRGRYSLFPAIQQPTLSKKCSILRQSKQKDKM